MTAWVVLGMAMVLSIAATLYFGRGTTFSGDEMVLVVASPGFDLTTAFTPHAGHLLLIPRLVYVPLLDLFGLDYLPYRILTVLSVCLTVGLLFTWLVRRVPRWVALVPCLILLFFGTDHLHVLQGNGFIICFTLAMGLLALLMMERGDLRGDAIACGSLLAAVATYSVGLPFVAGVAVLVLLNWEWRRLWVPLVPLLAYVVWLLWSKKQGFAGSGADLSTVVDYPKWGFDAAGAAIYGLTGLNFDLSGGEALDLIDWRAGILAALAIGAVIWCIWKGRSTKSLWVVLSIGLALWGLQVLVSTTGHRLPDDARYLYPGAVCCVLILGAAAQGLRWRKYALVLLYVFGAIGLIANVFLLERNGEHYRIQAEHFKSNAAIAVLALQTAVPGSDPAPASSTAEDRQASSSAATLISMTGVKYGYFPFTPEEMLDLDESQRLSIDGTLASTIGVKRSPVEAWPRTGCKSTKADGSGKVVVAAPRSNVIVRSQSGISDLMIGRFADVPSVSLGRLRPGRPVKVTIPTDHADLPWKLGGSGADLEVCPRG